MLGNQLLFRGIPQEGLVRLSEQGAPRTFPAGARLMTQGEDSNLLYIIMRGSVKVERTHPHLKHPLVLAELGPGETVGEMGIFERVARSATVTALEDTETLELSLPVVMD